MVGGQGWIVQAPVLEIIEIPLGEGQMRRDLHPMSLGFKVAMHGRCIEAWRMRQRRSSKHHELGMLNLYLNTPKSQSPT